MFLCRVISHGETATSCDERTFRFESLICDDDLGIATCEVGAVRRFVTRGGVDLLSELGVGRSRGGELFTTCDHDEQKRHEGGTNRLHHLNVSMSRPNGSRTFVSMSERVTLVEDGVERTPRKGANGRSSWLLAAGGFVVGLGLGVLVVAPTPDTLDEPVRVTTPIGDPPLVTSPDDGVPPGVGQVVPDFPDAMVVVSGTVGSALERTLWPNQAPMTSAPMTSGHMVELDSRSQYVALSNTVPGLEGSVVSMGRGNDVNPVASGVTGYVWHDTTAGWMGYTVDGEGVTQVFKTEGRPVPSHVVEWGEPDRRVVGWGDWGWALQGAADVVLLNEAGAFRDSEAGTALASHGSGWLFMIESGAPKLVSSGGGVVRIPADLDVGEPMAAEFSPDGDLVAVSGQGGVVVVDPSDGSVVELSGLITDTIAWSSDGRFVLTGTGAGVVVFDLETGEVRPVLRDHSVVEVGVVPLGTS